MRLTRLSLVIPALLALANCSGPETAPEAEPTEDTAKVSAADEGDAAADAADGAHIVRPDGVGSIRAGMTIAEVELLGKKVTVTQPPFDEGSSCAYARIAELPDMLVMLDGETLVRFDMISPPDEKAAPSPWKTMEGARIGTTEAELRKLYGDRLTIEPHPYTGPVGHYAIVHEEGAEHGVIFETDGERVTSWRTGQWDQVQWIEGCA